MSSNIVEAKLKFYATWSSFMVAIIVSLVVLLFIAGNVAKATGFVWDKVAYSEKPEVYINYEDESTVRGVFLSNVSSVINLPSDAEIVEIKGNVTCSNGICSGKGLVVWKGEVTLKQGSKIVFQGELEKLNTENYDIARVGLAIIAFISTFVVLEKLFLKGWKV